MTLCDDFEIKPDTGWAELDRKLEVLFHKLASTIDPESSLGLDFYTDVHCYSIGEVKYLSFKLVLSVCYVVITSNVL